MKGTWKPGFYYGSIKDGFTKLAPYGPRVSAKTKALIAAKERQMETGKFNEFCGPVKDQSGKVMIPKGTCWNPRTKAGISKLYSMQWLVQGVIGSVSHVPPPS
jgi:basic membrane lipoprotein Med (substrate-binding protein (PBP1-ABC) superfamily)